MPASTIVIPFCVHDVGSVYGINHAEQVPLVYLLAITVVEAGELEIDSIGLLVEWLNKLFTQPSPLVETDNFASVPNWLAKLD
jgi:hypothetical protein